MDINICFSTLQRTVINSDPHSLLPQRTSCRDVRGRRSHHSRLICPPAFTRIKKCPILNLCHLVEQLHVLDKPIYFCAEGVTTCSEASKSFSDLFSGYLASL